MQRWSLSLKCAAEVFDALLETYYGLANAFRADMTIEVEFIEARGKGSEFKDRSNCIASCKDSRLSSLLVVIRKPVLG